MADEVKRPHIIALSDEEAVAILGSLSTWGMLSQAGVIPKALCIKDDAENEVVKGVAVRLLAIYSPRHVEEMPEHIKGMIPEEVRKFMPEGLFDE